MTQTILDDVVEELENAIDVANDEAVLEELRHRSDKLADLAVRVDEQGDAVLEREHEALDPVDVDAGRAVQVHISEVNDRLGELRQRKP